MAAQGHQGVYNGEGGDPIFGGPKNMTMLLHHWYGNEQPDNHREKAYLASYRRSYEEINHLLTPEWQRKINAEQDLEAGSIRANLFFCQGTGRIIKKTNVQHRTLNGKR